jgi:hypothetical protein
MAWNEDYHARPFKSLVSFEGLQGRAVDLATSEINAAQFAAGGAGYGIVMNDPRTGEFATVAVRGVVRAKAAAAVSIGDYITVANSGAGGPGWLRSVVSGDTAPRTIMGRAMSSVASGSLFALELEVTRVRAVSSASLLGAL